MNADHIGFLSYQTNFSDCQIKIGDEMIPSHKSTLCQSNFFKAKLLEYSTLDLSKFDPYFIHRILKYMYGFKLSLTGNELFAIVKLSKEIEFPQLEVHGTCQLKNNKPLYILDVLIKVDNTLRETKKQRFVSGDVMKTFCLQKFQEIGQEKFIDSKETFDKFKSMSEDLRMELLVAPNFDNEEDSLLLEENDRDIQIREHFSTLLSQKSQLHCTLKSNNFEFGSHKFAKIIQNGNNPRLAFCSFPIKKGMNDIEICMKITKVSWVGVGVCETETHGTNLWSMNECIWTTNQKTHQSSGHLNYQTNDIIRMKISTKEQELY
eukprot:gene11248-4067_t